MHKCLKTFAPRLFQNLRKGINLLSHSKINFAPKHNFSTSPSINNSHAGLSAEEKQNLDYIESGVFELLKNSPKCKLDKLTRTAGLEEIGFDSLDIVELVIAVEEKFNITISGKKVI
jgi:acyl carrier protein